MKYEVKFIPKYEGMYMVDNRGNVYNHRSKRQLKPFLGGRKGYLQLGLSKEGIVKRFYVHTLVLETFLCSRPTSKHVCNHKDGNVKNNRLENLEWVTAKENTAHAKKTGLFNSIKNLLRIRSKRNKNSRRVIARALNHAETIIFPSLSAAASYGFNYSVVRECCLETRSHRTHKGFTFRFSTKEGGANGSK